MSEHQPVMVSEVLEGLNIRPEGIYVDATFGRGGHSRAILNCLNEHGRLLAMDRDPAAIHYANELAKNDKRFEFESERFSNVFNFCDRKGVKGKVDGMLADLGVSSPQLDQEARGFSFQKEGPLDMRMDQSQGVTAAEWINEATEEELSHVFKEFGEERFHRRIAHAIVSQRQSTSIQTTEQLSELIKKANPAWEKHKHPATRCFQAIRIYINQELIELKSFLEQSLTLLKPKGRLCIISFHSLEDRMVKQFINLHEKGENLPKKLPIEAYKIHQSLKHIGKAKKADQDEVLRNPRARSAILRVAEKIEKENEPMRERE